MGFFPEIVAQVQVDFVNDVVVGDSFGFDLASFAVVTPNTTYTINLDLDAQVADDQRQVIVSRTAAVAVAEGPLLVSPVAGPPVGLTITSTNVAGVAAASIFTHQLTVLRQGAVS